MNTSMKSLRSQSLKAALGLALALGSAQAMAAIYDITIKGTTGGNASTGQLEYNNSDTASAGCVGADHVPSNPSVTVTDTSAFGTVRPTVTFNTNIDLTVCTFTTELLKPGTQGNNESLKQGSNVEGLKGSLKSSNNQYKLTFLDMPETTQPFTRNYEIRRISNNALLKSGQYHIHNPLSVAPLPEPGSLLLLLPGLGALAWSRVRRSRRQGAGG